MERVDRLEPEPEEDNRGGIPRAVETEAGDALLAVTSVSRDRPHPPVDDSHAVPGGLEVAVGVEPIHPIQYVARCSLHDHGRCVAVEPDTEIVPDDRGGIVPLQNILPCDQ